MWDTHMYLQAKHPKETKNFFEKKVSFRIQQRQLLQNGAVCDRLVRSPWSHDLISSDSVRTKGRSVTIGWEQTVNEYIYAIKYQLFLLSFLPSL